MEERHRPTATAAVGAPPAPPPGAPAQASPPTRVRLSGRLGVPGLVLTVIAFSAPLAVMAGFTQLVIGYGNGLGAPVVFLVVGALLLLFAVGFTAMSHRMTSPGAYYSYITAGLGRPLGLSGAFVALGAYVGISAGSYPFAGLVADGLAQGVGDGISLPWWGWALVVWVVITVLGLLQIDLSTRILGVLVLAEIAFVAVWEAAVLVVGGPDGYVPQAFAPASAVSGSVGTALLFGMLCMVGLESAAVFRDETRDPLRSVPRATYAAIAFMAVFYALGTWAYIVALGPDGALEQSVADPSGSFFATAATYLGDVAVGAGSLLLITSVLAAINASQNAAARYLYSLGGDAVLSPALARVHPVLRSPFVAVLAVTTTCLVVNVAVVLLAVDPVPAYAALTGFGGFCLLVLLTMTSAAILTYFRRTPGHGVGVWHGVVAPLLALLGIGTTLVLAALNMATVIGSPTGGVVALVLVAAMVAAGAALAVRIARTRPDAYRRIGRQDL